jgi:hypothetical protein
LKTSATNNVVKSWVEDNDLWMEDNIDFVDNGMTEELFNKIIDIGKEIYAETAKEWNETLIVNPLWTNSTINANASRDGNGWTEINMYGGLSRRSEVIPIGFALVLCHELNHLYGGTPYIDVELKMSGEGQADVSGAGWCLKNIVEKLNDTTKIDITDYMKKVCNNDSVCIQQLAGGNSLGTLLSVLNKEKIPNYETPDKTIVKKTNTSYPRTTQCRLDSYHNGTLGLERPKCWFKP